MVGIIQMISIPKLLKNLDQNSWKGYYVIAVRGCTTVIHYNQRWICLFPFYGFHKQGKIWASHVNSEITIHNDYKFNSKTSNILY